MLSIVPYRLQVCRAWACREEQPALPAPWWVGPKMDELLKDITSCNNLKSL